MKEPSASSKAQKAAEEWQRLQESRKIKKIEDSDSEKKSGTATEEIRETNTSKKQQNNQDKDSFRDIA